MTFDELCEISGEAKERLARLCDFLKIDEKIEERKRLEVVMSEPNFWDSRERSQATVEALSGCKNIIEPYRDVEAEVADFEVLVELAEEDESILGEADDAWKQLSKHLDEIELISFLSGKFDAGGMFFSIHAGAGGTESCDWANMLMRMYRRWFERRGWKDEIVDIQPGDEAGIKSVTLRVKGQFSYGYGKGEKGVHRLVRISPFDSNARRHTSFCSIDVFPDIDEDIDIDIEEKDLRIDTFRASGAGGQHVNTTDSAIRITHVPTGVVVSCQMERSQHKNRHSAMQMLKARLYEMEEEKRRLEADAITGIKTEMGWGNQIRSYVLQPYQMVKDLRTEVETSNTSAVLDGDIDMFVEAWLKKVKS